MGIHTNCLWIALTFPDDDAVASTSTSIEAGGLSRAEEAKLMRKVDFHVLPMLFLIYVMAFLDR